MTLQVYTKGPSSEAASVCPEFVTEPASSKAHHHMPKQIQNSVENIDSNIYAI